jgi:HEPN domain-containing protein
MKKSTQQWVRKAEADLALAARARRKPAGLYDGICFHCQQCAEKYLKALLEELGLPIPKIHDLDQLFALLRQHHLALRSVLRGLVFLTDFAVDIRYPGNWATKRQAEAAWRWAERVRQTARSLLGIRERPRKP